MTGIFLYNTSLKSAHIMSLLWASNVGQNKMRDFVFMNDLFQIASQGCFYLVSQIQYMGTNILCQKFSPTFATGGTLWPSTGREGWSFSNLFNFLSLFLSHPLFSRKEFAFFYTCVSSCLTSSFLILTFIKSWTWQQKNKRGLIILFCFSPVLYKHAKIF